MEGWIFDLYFQSPDKMTLWLKTRDKGTVKLIDHWQPSFYVAGNAGDLDRLAGRLGSLVRHRMEEWYERVDSPHKSRVLRVFYSNRRECDHLKKLVWSLGREGSQYRMYNLDISPDQLYFYEKDLFPLAHVETLGSNGGEVQWNLLDSAYNTDYSPPRLCTAKLEITTANENSEFLKLNAPIGTIRVDDGRDIFTIDSGAESDKLLELMRCVKNLDPDVIVTAQGDSSQLPYLGWRAKANNLSHDFYLGRESTQKVPEKQEGQSYFSYGRVFYRSGPIRLLGRFHLDRENAFVYDDCGLDGLFELSRCCRIPLHRASRSTIGTGMTSLQMYTAYKDGFLIPWQKDTPEDFKTARELLIGDRGGFIYEPQTGLHENVGELDFSSLYPMLMLIKNISQETIRCSCCKESSESVPELNWNICSQRVGVVPKSLQILLMKRQVYKHLRKTEQSSELSDVYKQRSDALKWILVCCLPPESPVLVRQAGRTEYAPVGKVVDSFFGDDRGIIDCPVELFVAGIGHDLKSKFCRVGKLIKVASPETLLKVTMDDERQIICTPDHPFYVLREGGLVEVDAADLAKDDFVPVAKKISLEASPTVQLELLPLLNEKLSRSEQGSWFVKVNEERSLLKTDSSLTDQETASTLLVTMLREANGIAPFKHLRQITISSSPNSDLLIGHQGEEQEKNDVSWMPARLTLDEDVGFLLGFYLSAGSMGNRIIRLEVNTEDFAQEVAKHLSSILARKFKLIPRVYKEKKTGEAFVVRIDSSSLVGVFERVFELPRSFSEEPKVPGIIFNAPKDVVLGFLSGLVAGGEIGDNGVEEKESISIASHFYSFLVQLGYLGLSLGIPFVILPQGEGLYRVYFSWPNALPVFKNTFLKQLNRPRPNRIRKYECVSKCRHLSYETFPSGASGLKRVVEIARNVRSISLEGEPRLCRETARYLLERTEYSRRFGRLQKLHSNLTKLFNADVGFAMVNAVEKVESHTRYVYCFQLAKEEFPAFFTGDSGVLVHNCFGYLGFKNARFGKIDAHMAVCAFSRDILTRTAMFVEERGYNLLHGIVDSTWLKKDNASPEDYERLAAELGDHFKLPLSFEGIYRWIVFLPSKVYPNRPVLNRYYGVFSDGRVKVRGIALRRHDSPEIVKKLQTEVLAVLGTARGSEEFHELVPQAVKVLHAHVDRIRSGRVPAEYLVIRKNLSKDPKQYSHRVPQAIAAEQLRRNGLEVSAGQTVGYVILDSAKRSVKDVVAAGLLDGNVEYDVESYVSLLADGFAELLSPFGFSKEILARS